MKKSDDTKHKKLDLNEEQKLAAEQADAELDESTDEAEGSDLETQVAQLQEQLRAAEESARRALADYNNVVRRSQEERSKLVKMAAKDVILAVLLPLDHLHLAKEQFKDPGLNMVYQQFQQALLSQGAQEIDALGQPFDEDKMEVVDKRPVTDPLQENVVIGVTQRGYTLHGEVIRHARVVIGVAPEKE